jgi:pyruvate/2-oxoglutarate dehydrogenase complex dihydrolipoamide acyltransferase (E2) component
VSSSNIEHAGGDVVLEMPQMGVSIAEATLAVWHKRVGDWVEADEIICEVSSDKIDTDVPSPAAGRIVALLVAENETVPVGTSLATITTDASAGDAHPAEHDHDHAVVPDGGHALERDDGGAAERDNGGAAQTVDDRRVGDVGRAPTTDAPSAQTVYSPIAQRIAAEHGIDLAAVKGSGRGGRVRKQDVLAAVAARDASSATPTSREASAETTVEEGEPVAVARPSAGDSVELMSRMRRAIAEHMTRSLRTAAHCTTIVEADFSAVERQRARLGCSPLPIVARAVVEALQRHPALNATLQGELLTLHRDVNLGIAVSLGDRGLIVPVIHRAQDLSADGLASRIGELAHGAREGTLTPDDVRGGTFTITNPGSFGSIASTPIINQPQVAILDLEAVVKRPVAVIAGDGSDALAIRPVAYLCLSWDHRALDGAIAAQFLATLRGRLEREDRDG